MKARFMIEDPDLIEATMKITMKVKEWDLLRSVLDCHGPFQTAEQHGMSHWLTNTVTDLIGQARRVIYPSISFQEGNKK
jgi:hypothetical protein